MAPYLYLFLLGLLLQRGFATATPWLNGKRLQWLAIYLVACVVGESTGWDVGNNDAHPLLAMLLGVTTISLAFTARHLSERQLAGNDISYGTYIYHMLIVNACIALGFEGSVRWVSLSLLLTYVLAFLRWARGGWLKFPSCGASTRHSGRQVPLMLEVRISGSHPCAA